VGKGNKESYHRPIPPRSPHIGGIYATAVMVAKQLLVTCLNGAVPNHELYVGAESFH